MRLTVDKISAKVGKVRALARSLSRSCARSRSCAPMLTAGARARSRSNARMRTQPVDLRTVRYLPLGGKQVRSRMRATPSAAAGSLRRARVYVYVRVRVLLQLDELGSMKNCQKLRRIHLEYVDVAAPFPVGALMKKDERDSHGGGDVNGRNHAQEQPLSHAQGDRWCVRAPASMRRVDPCANQLKLDSACAVPFRAVLCCACRSLACSRTSLALALALALALLTSLSPSRLLAFSPSPSPTPSPTPSPVSASPRPGPLPPCRCCPLRSVRCAHDPPRHVRRQPDRQDCGVPCLRDRPPAQAPRAGRTVRSPARTEDPPPIPRPSPAHPACVRPPTVPDPQRRHAGGAMGRVHRAPRVPAAQLHGLGASVRGQRRRVRRQHRRGG